MMGDAHCTAAEKENCQQAREPYRWECSADVEL